MSERRGRLAVLGRADPHDSIGENEMLTRQGRQTPLSTAPSLLRAAATAVVVLAVAGTALAVETVQNVGGLAIYLGVVPAEMLQGHATGHPEKQMHGGPPTKALRQRHVLIAVFDTNSGARIEDAIVTAKVGEPGLARVEKRLDPMPIGGAASYGNYFSMSSPGTYQIEVRVVLPGTGRTVDARFTYAVPR